MTGPNPIWRVGTGKAAFFEGRFCFLERVYAPMGRFNARFPVLQKILLGVPVEARADNPAVMRPI
jgi:hypothetical protein